jgi:NADPH:quinone reductase-like Zn-dependent oxidoreductase
LTEVANQAHASGREDSGSLFVVGTTAYAAVRAVSAGKGDTVVVSGAAGGVGSVAVQPAKNAGATVIGLAGVANHDWLAEHGVLPVAYGEGAADQGGRAREAPSRGRGGASRSQVRYSR